MTAKDLKKPILSESIDCLSRLGFASAKIAPKNSLLILVRGMTLHKDVPVCLAGRDVAFNQDIKALVVSPEIDTHYLAYYLQSSKSSLMKLVDSAGHGTGRLNTDLLKAFPISFPPHPEQTAIANLLSTWDEAIEKTERLIQAKEKTHKQISKELLFGRSRMAGQQSRFREGHFFSYPSDWGLIKIGEVASEVSLRNGETDSTVLSCSKYDGFVNSLDYFGKQVFSSDTSNYKVIHKGQFGYPSNHIEEGSIGLLEHCERGIVSPIYLVFEVDPQKVHAPYLYKLLKTEVYRHIFRVSTSSSVDRRGSLRWSEFSRIKALLPSLEEQQKITGVLSTCQQEINLLKQLADRYREQKRGLMQKLLTGRWQVKMNKEVA